MKRRGRIRYDQEPNGVVSHGAFRVRELTVEFTTSEPSPGQWIAIATIRTLSARTPRQPSRMIVGRGSSESGALADLRRRVNNSDARARRTEPSEPCEEPGVVWVDQHYVTTDP